MALGQILTQVRSAMERSREWKLAGDQLASPSASLWRPPSRTTETDIARNTSPVNALGWKPSSSGLGERRSVLMIGAGQTHANIARYLVKRGTPLFAS